MARNTSSNLCHLLYTTNGVFSLRKTPFSIFGGKLRGSVCFLSFLRKSNLLKHPIRRETSKSSKHYLHNYNRNMNLFEECLQVLGSNVVVLNKQDSISISHTMQSTFPFTPWRVCWDKIENKKILQNPEELGEILLQQLPTVFVAWTDMALPILKCPLPIILQYINDVTCVCFDTWIFSLDEQWIVEFYHEGEVLFGSLA